ncbi:MAG: hypothetical protein AAGF92_06270 [Myxococcota bacterium]
MYSTRRWLGFLSVALLVACGSGDSEWVALEIDVVEFAPSSDDVPVAEVEVCEFETSNCETTDDAGFVTIQLPVSSEVTLSVIKEGYTPTLSPQVTRDEDVDGLRTAIIRESTTQALALTLGIPFPLEGGVIAISAVTPPVRRQDNGLAGATFAVDGVAPYYLDEIGFPTFAADATSEPDGVGGYVELANGVYEITIGGVDEPCGVISAWPGRTPRSIRVPVAAGFITQAFVACGP